MVYGSKAQQTYGTKLLEKARDRLYALDVLRSCYAISNVFEEGAVNLARQDVPSTDGVIVA